MAPKKHRAESEAGDDAASIWSAESSTRREKRHRSSSKRNKDKDGIDDAASIASHESSKRHHHRSSRKDKDTKSKDEDPFNDRLSEEGSIASESRHRKKSSSSKKDKEKEKEREKEEKKQREEERKQREKEREKERKREKEREKERKEEKQRERERQKAQEREEKYKQKKVKEAAAAAAQEYKPAVANSSSKRTQADFPSTQAGSSKQQEASPAQDRSARRTGNSFFNRLGGRGDEKKARTAEAKAYSARARAGRALAERRRHHLKIGITFAVTAALFGAGWYMYKQRMFKDFMLSKVWDRIKALWPWGKAPKPTTKWLPKKSAPPPSRWGLSSR